MSKFKVGDRVLVTDHETCFKNFTKEPARLTRVPNVSETGWSGEVEFERPDTGHDDRNNWYVGLRHIEHAPVFKHGEVWKDSRRDTPVLIIKDGRSMDAKKLLDYMAKAEKALGRCLRWADPSSTDETTAYLTTRICTRDKWQRNRKNEKRAKKEEKKTGEPAPALCPEGAVTEMNARDQSELNPIMLKAAEQVKE